MTQGRSEISGRHFL